MGGLMCQTGPDMMGPMGPMGPDMMGPMGPDMMGPMGPPFPVPGGFRGRGRGRGRGGRGRGRGGNFPSADFVGFGDFNDNGPFPDVPFMEPEPEPGDYNPMMMLAGAR